MPEFRKGIFTLDLGFVKIGGEVTEEDRQCAWELYSEIVTRVAIVGKRKDPTARNFDGEIYAESLTSVFRFFQECRNIMRKFPVGKIGESDQVHLGILINRILAHVLRPFLEKWHGPYRAWWEQHSRTGKSPFEIQHEFPKTKLMLEDWTDVRLVMRQVEKTLCKAYKLKPVDELSSYNK